MFIIDQSETYKWPITVKTLDEAGKTKTQTFTAIFKRLPQTRLEEIGKAQGLSDRELCKEILLGWEDVTDAAGAALPFTTSTLDRLLDSAGIASLLVTEFIQSITGGAARKN